LLTIAAGLGYGPAFKALSHGWVEADRAVAVFEPACLGTDVDRYHLHPALVDCAFQLIIQLLRDEVAAQGGVTYIPTRIGHVSFRAGSQRPHVARARVLRRGPHSLCAEYELFAANGETIALFEEVRLRSVRLQRNAAEHVRYFEYAAVPKPMALPPAAVEAGAHARLDQALRRCFENAEVRRTQRLYVEEIDPLLDALCDRFVAESLKQLEPAALSAGPYHSHLLATAAADGALDDPDASCAQDIWNSLISDYPDFFALVHAVGCVGVQLPRLLQHPRALAEVLPAHLTRSTLQRQAMGTAARLQLIGALRAHIEHALRDLPEGQRLGLLEISANAPWLAAELCRGLDFDRADYQFLSTQVSALEDARRLQEKYSALTAASLDEAGAAQHHCSLAIVSLDFASLRDTTRALECARARLAPGGVLLLVGQHPSRAFDFVFGVDPLWWSETSEGSAQSVQRPPQFWQQYLQQIGFGQFSRHEYATGTPCGAYLLLARCDGAAAREAVASPRAGGRHWLLLADSAGYSAQLASCLGEQLRAGGDRFTLEVPSERESLVQILTESAARVGPLSGIVHLSGLCALDMTSPAELLDLQVDRCALAAALIQACESTQIDASCCFVTANTARHLLPSRIATVADSHWAIADAALAGFARTLMNEGLIGAVRLIDLEITQEIANTPPAATAALLARELQIDDAEQEIILTAANARYAPRLRASEPPRADQATDAAAGNSRRALGFAVPGQLRNLQWQSLPRAPLREDEIEVAVKATGLNFRDVMYALGLLSDEGVEHGFAGASLGLEFSGVVVRLGAQATGFDIGDAVVGFAPSSFSERIVTQSGALSHIPAGLSFEAAATIPSTFFTAYYSLHTLAGLREGEKVLIHGAAGGVGIAAVQVAKWCGAEVIATAGSDEKRNFLRLLGADHIYDSRSLAFADQILQLTRGRGVDVVLNSLAGEAINRNFRVLKPFGRFLELGKRDFYENTRIGLRPFRNNISYFGIDADQLMRERPELTQRLFGEVLQLFNDGVFHALPYQAFEAREVIDAFRHMQQARQIGKIVVTYDCGIPEAVRADRGPSQRLHLTGDATYLVTGGLTGFGLRTAEWLVERGARNLVLLGRRGAGADEAQTLLARLERRGIKLLALACDVTDRSSLSAVLERIARELPPLRGVVHAATVIDDALIRDMNSAQIRRVLAPKVLGALHLHELTRALPLDFFVMYSSATTLFGNPGQGNYIAANFTLEALCRARRASGLPATCVRWGAIDDVGFLARTPKLKQALQDRMGGAALPSAVALDVLEAMLLSDRSDLGVLELDWRALRRSLPSATASKFLQIALNVAHGDGEEDGSLDLARMLRELPPEELQSHVIDLLKLEIGEILRIAPEKIDPARAMQEMGFDSLMGVELVVAVENRFGVRLPVLALNDSPTVAKLAARIIKQLHGDDGASPQDEQQDATRAQIERIASQHAVTVPSAAEIERIASDLRTAEPGVNRRMIQ
jgi:NADPH:quinone reductase-like Zn-dependent oxidoreductase/NADP-dependent 3-hydroxy acid dehydrogenase YdfG/acyl carrier protein